MKYLSKILCIISVGMFTASCAEDIEGGDVTLPLTVTTPKVLSVNPTSAVLSATATGSHITSRGFCYATTANPTVDHGKVLAQSKNMKAMISSLVLGTTYHVRAYAQTSYETVYSDDITFTTANDSSTDDEVQTEGPEALKRVVVHDPSVVWDPSTSQYYIFGSHRAAARSGNLMSWTEVTAPWATETSSNASNADAFTTPQVTKMKKGGREIDFTFDAQAWSKRGSSSYNVDGNMWAPDVVYNKAMKKWCMYLSVNGDGWYSSIILLTADKIDGPYRYQSPVVMSGFRSGDSYKATDLEIVLGEQASLPSRYAPSDNYGNHWPNAIDPCVFYDEDGKLWMTYGSWSGGIFMLELDEQTGLRDYDVTYAENETSDPYFGKKIAGGHYVSGEASYIEYIGGYYYLFVSYGGFAAADGYQMRVFRSLNPDGPYVDSKGSSALVNQYYLNFGPKADDGNRGVNIFGAYGEWGYQAVGAWSERSQGHNSVIASEDGRAYLVYHTRFQGQGEGHQVRVHQLYQNEDNWLVAAPFEYTGEVAKTARIAYRQYIATAQIPGKYKLLVHDYKLDHAAKAYATPVDVVLNADGTITGAYSGTWSATAGTSYVTINIGKAYKGVMVEQTLEPKNEKTPCFTALNAQTGVTVWGYRVADN